MIDWRCKSCERPIFLDMRGFLAKFADAFAHTVVLTNSS